MARNTYFSLTMVAVAMIFVLGSSARAQAPTPRMPDGRPDLSGMWIGGQVEADPEEGPRSASAGAFISALDADGNLLELNRARPCHPGQRCWAAVNQSTDSTFTARMDPNRPKYKPEFWDRVQYLDRHSNQEDPLISCFPRGVPAAGAPGKILQTPKEIVMFYGSDVRVIPIDGRKHDPLKSKDLYYYGHSIGYWEGDTLVIDSVAFNDHMWMKRGGYFHSNNMTVIERFTREGNQLRYQAIVTDPDVLLEPWAMNRLVLTLNPDPMAIRDEPLPCDERDREHMIGLIHH